MKRTIVWSFLVFVTGSVNGQVLRTGSVVECSEFNITLQPGKTLDQYMHLLNDQMTPAIETAFPGSQIYFTKGTRGNADSKAGAIWVFGTQELRFRYFDKEGILTPLGENAWNEVSGVVSQLEEIGTATRKFSQWVVINQPHSAEEAAYYEYLIAYTSQRDYKEVPIAPATIGISDPLLAQLCTQIAELTAELVTSGLREDDPSYSQFSTRIDRLKESLNEAATALAAAANQAFVKGGSFGEHILTISLAPDVTMDQYLDYLTKNYAPELEKQLKEAKVLVMRPLEGIPENRVALVMYFKSEESRDKYWPGPGQSTPLADEAMSQVGPVLNELQEMGSWTDDYGVWLIQ